VIWRRVLRKEVLSNRFWFRMKLTAAVYTF